MLVNYYNLSQALLSKVAEINKQTGVKRKLVIHGCCAPCSCYPIEVLDVYFDVTILYTNSNIYPKEEYDIRLNELIEYIKTYNETHGSDIKLVVPTYDNVSYTKLIKDRGNSREGGEICFKCYEMRIRDAFEYAKEHKFDYAGTVMSISRQKSSIKLNEIGLQLQMEYPDIEFLVADFKKKGGQNRRDELSKDMYRQKYCGCVFSYQEYLKRSELQKIEE